MSDRAYWRDVVTQHLVDQQPLTREQVENIVRFVDGKVEDYEERLPNQFWHSSFPPFPEGWEEDMREIEHPYDGGVSIEHRADEGKFLLQGYDMDTSEWKFEGAIHEVWDHVIENGWYIRKCCGVCLSNSRGELITLEVDWIPHGLM